MWAVSGWALATWLKVTVVLVALVGAAWLAWGAHSGRFLLAVTGAGVLELYTVR